MKRTGMTAAWRTGVFANVILVCALGVFLAIGVVAIVRQLSWNRDLRFDWTAAREYTLTEEDMSMLRAVQAPVDILFSWGFDQQIQRRVLDAQGAPRADLLVTHYRPLLQDAAHRVHRVLEEWSHVSPQISFRVLDAESAPGELEDEAMRLGRKPEELLNRVLVRQSGRHREVPLERMMHGTDWGWFPSTPGSMPQFPKPPATWGVSEELGAAVRSLASGVQPRIGIVTGHDSMLEPGSGALGALTAVLNAEGCDVQPVEIARTESLDSLSALLVPAPRKRLTRGELAALHEWVGRGGRVMLIADPRFAEDYAGLLEPLGLQLPAQVVDDRALRDPSRSSGVDLQSTHFCAGDHPIDTPLRERMALYLGPSRPVVRTADSEAGVQVTPLLRASGEADAIPVTHDVTHGTYSAIEGARVRTPKPVLAVAVQRNLGTARREGRVVVLGGGGLVAPDELSLSTHFGNREFLMNCITWMCDRPFSTRAGVRDDSRPRLVSIGAAAEPVRWIAVIALPLLAFALAGAVWFARRSTSA